MTKELAFARARLLSEGCTCFLYDGKREILSRERGVRPLLSLLDEHGRLEGFVAADKTVGLGAAHLYLLLGVHAVWAAVMSEGARELLHKGGVVALCDTLVPYIINRQGNGRCPIESAVETIEQSEDAVCAIREALKKLSERNKNEQKM